MPSLKQLYIDVRTKILSLQKDGQPLVAFCQAWNDQLNRLRDPQSDQYSFPFPAVFIEMSSPYTTSQLGNGAQMVSVTVRLHIIHEFYNNIVTDDGIMEQDLEVFDLRDGLYYGLNKFEPDGAGAFQRVSETQDFAHDNLYHFIQDYITEYIDLSRNEPLNGQDATITGIEVQVVASPTFLHQPD